VLRDSGHVVDIQTEEDRGDQTTLRHPARMPRRDDVAVRKDASNSDPERRTRWCERGKKRN
jgi:hypothetical protein